MSHEISSSWIAKYRNKLESHDIYAAVTTIDDLRIFMQHHVYSVWDFMSLIKYLQSIVAPTQYPWLPHPQSDTVRFINELVLEEESDSTVNENQFSSHFELYQTAMHEVDADTSVIQNFIEQVRNSGIHQALQLPVIPQPSREFTTTTFKFINSGKPHEVAAALGLGREHIIPTIFRSILKNIGVDANQAPVFHFYLNKHIHLDEDFHAPLSLKLLEALCDNDAEKIDEAQRAADQAVQARLTFWDGVLKAIEDNRTSKAC